MYVTEEKFDVAMQKIDDRFEASDKRLDKIEAEVSGVYVFVRQTFDEFYIKITEEFSRQVGVLTESYQPKLEVLAEKVDLTWERCDRRCSELEAKFDKHFLYRNKNGSRRKR